MHLPNGETLMHGPRTPYDPVKAHEYYLKTRKLKGRRKAQPQQVNFNRPNAFTGQPKNPFFGKGKSTFTVKLPDGTTATLNEQQLNEQRAYATKRVTDIKKNLAKLSSALKKKMVEARAADAKAKRGPTAADKRKAAKDSKQYRQKHKQQLSNKRKAEGTKTSTKSEPKSDSVASLQKQVTEIKGRLATAVARQRALTSATKSS
jgi:hypothetical protein